MKTSSRKWALGLLIAMMQAVWVGPSHADVPEVFRMDLSVMAYSGANGFLGGVFDQYPPPLNRELVMLFDVTATVTPTNRIGFSAGVPVGLLYDSVYDYSWEDVEWEFRLVDPHFEANLLLINEKKFLPAIRLHGGLGIPVGDEQLGSMIRASARTTCSKAFGMHTLFVDGNYSTYFEDDSMERDPLTTLVAGYGFPVSASLYGTIHVGKVFGGELRENNEVLAPAVDDIFTGLDFSVYSQGRCLFTVYVGAQGVDNDDPIYIFGIKIPLFSVRPKGFN